MKKTITFIIILFILGQTDSSAQALEPLSKYQFSKYQRNKKRAQDRYDNFAYAKGIEDYKNALSVWPEDDTIKYEIARGFYLTGQLDSAKNWYDQVMTKVNSTGDDEHYLNYAELLTSEGEYLEAEKWFKQYQENHPDETRVKERLDGLQQVLKFYHDSLRFEISHEDFNSSGYDFSPTYYEGDVVFISSRETSGSMQFLKPKYDWDKSYFLNTFRKNSTGQVDLLHKTFKTSYHEGPSTFYDHDNKVLFTRNNVEKGHVKVEDKKLRVSGKRIKESKDGVNKLKLFYSEKDEKGNWKIPVELWFNSDQYSCGHPTISKDLQRLYFTSDKEGGHGKTDLYRSIWRNGVWGEPENMGHLINTEGAEMFPYIDENNTLYFASNGHQGLGGLDVFKVDLNDENAKPKNLGYPMNTSKDDFGIVVKNMGDYLEGYFSSNRLGGQGLDDIYHFRYLLKMRIPGQVIDIQNGQPIASAQAGVSDESHDDNTMIVSNTDANGMFHYDYLLDNDYYVAATKKEYTRDTMRIHPAQYVSDTIKLHIIQNLLIKGIITDKIKGDTLEAVKIIVTNEKTGKKFGMITKEDGHYSFLAEPDTKYSFQLKKHKYFTSTSSVDTKGKKSGIVHHDGELEELFIGKPIVLNDIHFDRAKWNIRPDAATELDKFYQQLIDNPSIIVELSTHTDCRASDQYNETLSDKRAKSSAQYLIEKGIADKRIEGKGYGENQLLNECEDGVSCTEEQHQMNRRAEFKVTGFLPSEETNDEKQLLWIEPEYVAASLAKESSVVLVSYDTRGTKMVSGTIANEAGNPVSKAMITLMEEGTNQASHIQSNTDGTFSIKVFPERSYKLIVEATGYIEEGEKFKGNEKENVSFVLTKS